MADLSNKSLSLLLLVTIVVSFAGSLMMLNRFEALGITGRATDTATGTTNFSIESELAIQFTTSNVNFGSGFVNGSWPHCQMGTNGTFQTLNCVNFTRPTGNLTLENIGNIFANVSLGMNKNATDFIGGTGPNLTISVFQNETGVTLHSCAVNTTYNSSLLGKQVDGNETTSIGAKVCRALNFSPATNSVKILVNLKIPSNAYTGRHNVTFTATACDDSSC